MTFISIEFELEFEIALLDLLREYQDISAWSYEEIPGLRSKLITHKLAVNPSFKPIKKTKRNSNNDI